MENGMNHFVITRRLNLLRVERCNSLLLNRSSGGESRQSSVKFVVLLATTVVH